MTDAGCWWINVLLDPEWMSIEEEMKTASALYINNNSLIFGTLQK